MSSSALPPSTSRTFSSAFPPRYLVLSGECPGEGFWCQARTYEELLEHVRQVWGEDYYPVFKYRAQASPSGAEEEIRYHSSSSIFGFEQLPGVKRHMVKNTTREAGQTSARSTTIKAANAPLSPSSSLPSSLKTAEVAREETVSVGQGSSARASLHLGSKYGHHRSVNQGEMPLVRDEKHSQRSESSITAEERTKNVNEEEEKDKKCIPSDNVTVGCTAEERSEKKVNDQVLCSSSFSATNTSSSADLPDCKEEKGHCVKKHEKSDPLELEQEEDKRQTEVFSTSTLVTCGYYPRPVAGRTGMCFVIIDDALDFNIWLTGGAVLRDATTHSQVEEKEACSSLLPAPMEPLTAKLFAFQKTTLERPDILFHEMDSVRMMTCQKEKLPLSFSNPYTHSCRSPCLSSPTTVGTEANVNEKDTTSEGSGSQPKYDAAACPHPNGTEKKVGDSKTFSLRYRPYYHTITNKDGIFRFRSSPAVKHHEDSVVRVPFHSLLPPLWLVKLNITCVLRHSNASEVILWQAGSPLSGGSGWWGQLWLKAASAWGIHRPLFCYVDFTMGVQKFFITDVIQFRMWAEGIGMDRPELLVLEQAPSSNLCVDAQLKQHIQEHFAAHPPGPPQPPRELTLQKIAEKLLQLERNELVKRVNRGKNGKTFGWSVKEDPVETAQLKSPYVAGIPLHRLGIRSSESSREHSAAGKSWEGLQMGESDLEKKEVGEVAESRRREKKSVREGKKNGVTLQKKENQVAAREGDTLREHMGAWESPMEEKRHMRWGKTDDRDEEKNRVEDGFWEEEDEEEGDSDNEEDEEWEEESGAFTLMELEILLQVLKEQGRPTVALAELIEVEKRMQKITRASAFASPTNLSSPKPYVSSTGSTDSPSCVLKETQREEKGRIENVEENRQKMSVLTKFGELDKQQEEKTKGESVKENREHEERQENGERLVRSAERTCMTSTSSQEGEKKEGELLFSPTLLKSASSPLLAGRPPLSHAPKPACTPFRASSSESLSPTAAKNPHSPSPRRKRRGSPLKKEKKVRESMRISSCTSPWTVAAILEEAEAASAIFSHSPTVTGSRRGISSPHTANVTSAPPPDVFPIISPSFSPLGPLRALPSLYPHSPYLEYRTGSGTNTFTSKVSGGRRVQKVSPTRHDTPNERIKRDKNEKNSRPSSFSTSSMSAFPLISHSTAETNPTPLSSAVPAFLHSFRALKRSCCPLSKRECGRPQQQSIQRGDYGPHFTTPAWPARVETRCTGGGHQAEEEWYDGLPSSPFFTVNQLRQEAEHHRRLLRAKASMGFRDEVLGKGAKKPHKEGGEM